MAVASGPEQAPPGDAGSPEGPCEVTIVAHDIGPVGGMERVLSELILGLRRRGDRVTVIARTCELPEGSGVNFHRVLGPGRPFLLAYPWFLLAGSLTAARRARGVLQVTGGIVLNRADVVSVHYCHQVGPANPSRAGALYRANIQLVRIAKRLSERARLPPQPRGGLRLRLRGRRRRGARALPGAGAARDRDPQRRGPGALRTGPLERAGDGPSASGSASASGSWWRCS